MEETPKGGRGPPWAVAPLERERGTVVSGVNLRISKLKDLSIVCDRDTENTVITVQLVL